MTMHDSETGEVMITPSLDIETSATFGDLMGAIAQAQAKIENAEKDAKNPHFNSKYATLASVYAACRTALAEAGIAVIQAPFNLPDGDIGVATMLGHSSGQWLKARLYCKPGKYDAHGLGSVITYMRRYSLSAMVGVAPEDDDGNAAVGKPSEQRASPPPRQQAQQRSQDGQQQASQANGAEPEDAKRARIQAAYNAISKEIAECLDHQDLDDIRVRNEAALDEIKAFSPTSYEKLKDRVAKRKAQITNGPDAGEAEPKL